MRDIERAIKDYKKMFINAKSTKEGAFWLSDAHQVAKISNYEIWSCIFNALEAGFIIGYRYAKRKQNKK